MKFITDVIRAIITKVNSTPYLIWLILYSAYFILLSWYTRDYLGFSGDFAEYSNNPLRILQGQLPYKDFFLVYPPGEVIIPTLIYKIHGVNTDILRFVSIIISWTTTVAVFFFAKSIFKTNMRAIIFTLIYSFTSVIFFYCGPDYIHLYYFFIFLSFVSLYFFIHQEKKFFIFLAGLFIGLGLLFRVYEVLAAGFGMYLALLVFSITNKYSIFQLIKLSLYYLSGILIMVAFYYLAFAEYFNLMINQVFILSLKNGTAMSLPYFSNVQNYIADIGSDISSLTHNFSLKVLISLLFHLIKILVSSVYYLLPLTIVIALVWFIRQKENLRIKGISFILFGWATVSFLKASSRSDMAHLAPFLAPALMFLFYILITQYKNLRNSKLVYYFVVTSLVITLSSSISPITRFAQIYSKPNYTFKTETGSIIFTAKKDHDEFSELVNYISANSTENDFIFATDWFLPPIHALTGRMNPTYYDSMNDLVILSSIANQKSIIRDLKRNKTKFIIHNPEWGYDNKPEQQFRVACSLLQNFFDTECELITSIGNQQILKLKEY
jgi:hypothetical protein